MPYRNLGDLVASQTQTRRTLLTPEQWQSAAARFRGDATPEQLAVSDTLQLTQVEFAADYLAARSGGGGGGSDYTAEEISACDCAVAALGYQMDKAGTPLADVPGVQALCLSDYSGFIAYMEDSGLETDCSVARPIYKKPLFWVGAAVVAAVVWKFVL